MRDARESGVTFHVRLPNPYQEDIANVQVAITLDEQGTPMRFARKPLEPMAVPRQDSQLYWRPNRTYLPPLTTQKPLDASSQAQFCSPNVKQPSVGPGFTASGIPRQVSPTPDTESPVVKKRRIVVLQPNEAPEKSVIESANGGVPPVRSAGGEHASDNYYSSEKDTDVILDDTATSGISRVEGSGLLSGTNEAALNGDQQTLQEREEEHLPDDHLLDITSLVGNNVYHPLVRPIEVVEDHSEGRASHSTGKDADISKETSKQQHSSPKFISDNDNARPAGLHNENSEARSPVKIRIRLLTTPIKKTVKPSKRNSRHDRFDTISYTKTKSGQVDKALSSSTDDDEEPESERRPAVVSEGQIKTGSINEQPSQKASGPRSLGFRRNSFTPINAKPSHSITDQKDGKKDSSASITSQKVISRAKTKLAGSQRRVSVDSSSNKLPSEPGSTTPSKALGAHNGDDNSGKSPALSLPTPFAWPEDQMIKHWIIQLKPLKFIQKIYKGKRAPEQIKERFEYLTERLKIAVSNRAGKIAFGENRYYKASARNLSTKGRIPTSDRMLFDYELSTLGQP